MKTKHECKDTREKKKCTCTTCTCKSEVVQTTHNINGEVKNHTSTFSKAEKISFGTALNLIKEYTGKAMRLPKWSEDVRIRIQYSDVNSKMTASYLYVESRFGCVPWIPTQIELLSNDWMVI